MIYIYMYICTYIYIYVAIYLCVYFNIQIFIPIFIFEKIWVYTGKYGYGLRSLASKSSQADPHLHNEGCAHALIHRKTIASLVPLPQLGLIPLIRNDSTQKYEKVEKGSSNIK